MRSSNLFRIGGLAAGGVLVVGMLGAGMDGTPVSWAKRAVLESLGAGTPAVQTAFYEGQSKEGSLLHLVGRPAEKQESRERAEARKLERLQGKPEEVGRPVTQKEMIEHCMQQPNCRQKLEKIKNGKSLGKSRAARTGPSPEEIELEKLPKPPKGNPGGPRSQFSPNLSVSSFLAWVNPLNPSVAEAAAFYATMSPYRTAAGTSVGYFQFANYGGRQYGNQKPLIFSGWASPYPNPITENKSYAYMGGQLPSKGIYLVEFKGSRAHGKVQHSGGESWTNDYSKATSCDYSCPWTDVAEYEAGWHSWYFYSLAGWLYLDGGTVMAYTNS